MNLLKKKKKKRVARYEYNQTRLPGSILDFVPPKNDNEQCYISAIQKRASSIDITTVDETLLVCKFEVLYGVM